MTDSATDSEPIHPRPTAEPVHLRPTAEPVHLRPTAELAERVLLPGDPGRALALAQKLISEPKMFNHHRGLWGYTGPARIDGEPVTIQSTGMGGPSAAIVLSELISLGARRAIRVGTCGALRPGLRLGELVVARDASGHDGSSPALAGAERIGADKGLTDALIAAAPEARAGTVVSVDLFYSPDGLPGETKALAIEMESATLFALGARARIPVGCVLTVTDTFDATGARTRIDDRALLSAAESMGAGALAALAV
jgi:purine-nucleoside phosphorylase